MALNNNLTIYKGESINIRFAARDVNNTPIDLTNYSARGQLRRTFGSTGILIDLNPTIHNSFVSGFVDVFISGSQTANLKVDKNVYDIEVYTSGEAEVLKVSRGYADVLPEVTI